MKVQDADTVHERMKEMGAMEKIEKPIQTIPNGYIPIELSTDGKLGVPKVIHCRNFSTSDILDISLFNDTMLPEKVISVLNTLILEKIDVALWPDKVIIELLIKLYVNFFTPLLPQINFPWNKEDISWLEEKGRKEDIENLRSGKWKPKIDFNLTWLKTRKLSDNVKPYIVISKSGFSAKFVSYPRYGDSLIIKKATDNKFAESDKMFERIKQNYQLRERFLQEGKSINNLEIVNELDFLKWKSYEAKKAIYVAKASQALYLVAFNGIDVSQSSLEERISIMENPEFDIRLTKKLDREYEKINFGIDPEVEISNPITGERCLRHFSFRLVDIIQAIRLSECDEYDVSYDE
jgi:hypothetical protein